MRATRLFLLELIIVIIREKDTSSGIPHYAVFSNLLSLDFSSVQIHYSPQHPVLNHPQSMFLP
jgi:hypothetical protein